MEPAAPAAKTKENPVVKGGVIVLAVFVLFVLAAYFYLRSPHFSGSAVSSIDITMHTQGSPTSKPKVLVQASITNAPACASLLALLRSARFHTDHKCADIGSFTIRYVNGKADTLWFLPGHHPTSYEVRFNGLLYRIPRDRFYQILRGAGIDTTNVPESEH
jgi:hypothetical protein